MLTKLAILICLWSICFAGLAIMAIRSGELRWKRR